MRLQDLTTLSMVVGNINDIEAEGSEEIILDEIETKLLKLIADVAVKFQQV